MLTAGMAESQDSKVSFADVQPSVFEQFLKYLYTACISPDDLTPDIALQLIPIVHQYCTCFFFPPSFFSLKVVVFTHKNMSAALGPVYPLQLHCERVVKSAVDKDSINIIADIALYHECSILDPHCNKFLMDNLTDISLSSSFGYLNDKVLSNVVHATTARDIEKCNSQPHNMNTYSINLFCHYLESLDRVADGIFLLFPSLSHSLTL
jgi:hypothetical protein